MFRQRIEVRTVLILLAVALAVRLLTALPMRQPGFMDAHYYYVGALNLAQGRGFNDPYLWYYLDDPAGIPHPSHLYWMPLPSLIAWLGVALFGPGYRAGQAGFIVLSALLPLLSYAVARRVSKARRHAVLAALVTVFSGFYTHFWVSTESATPFALAGSLALLALGLALESGRAAWLALAGAAAGLACLARSDGLLLLLVALPVCLLRLPHSSLLTPHSSRFTPHSSRFTPHSSLLTPHSSRFTPHSSRMAYGVSRVALVLAAFLLVTAPWLYRNWRVAGAPLPGAGLQSLWFRAYDDLYSYGRAFSLRSYLDWGWGNILRSKLRVAAANLATLAAVDGLIFLFPLMLIGLWTLRRRRLYWPFLLYAPLLWLSMTVAFTYPGWRGGLLHASAAWLPFTLPAAMLGLERGVAWLAGRRRAWDARQASRVFGVGAALLAVLLSGLVYARTVLGGSLSAPLWNRSDQVYVTVGDWLTRHAAPDARAMVNNPPSFYYHTGRSSVVVPAEGPETLLEICARYDVRYVVLDRNVVPALRPLYAGQAPQPRLIERLRLAGGAGPVVVYEVAPP